MEPQKINNILPEVVEKIEQKKEEVKKEKQTFAITKKENNIPMEQNCLELGLILNTSSEEQKTGVAKRKLGNGKYVSIEATRTGELCRREDITTLLACFMLLQHSGKRKGNSFETTYYQISKILDGAGGFQYKDIQKSLGRLQENNVETNFWWDNTSGKRIIQEKFHFLTRISDREQKVVKISFDEEIAKSMEIGYVKFLKKRELSDILKIKSYHAKALILLFIKRFGGSSFIPEYKVDTILEYLGVKNRYDKLPIKKKNFNIKRTIIPAVQEAANFLGFSVTYNDTGEKDVKGNIIPDPKGQEKIRFYKEQEYLFAETTKSGAKENSLTPEERNLLEKKQKELEESIEKTNKNS
ncbi:MAG: hypothetical protein M1501_00960 [Candidatus Omnitrophica bacterium]|nr:hypothetical protein [Candidatus Omnitrophota bacterium]